MSDRTPRTVEGDRTISPAAGVSWWTMRRVITIGACSAMALVAFIVWKNDTPNKVDKNALPEKPTLVASSQTLYKPPPSDDVAPVKRAVMQQPAPEQARPPAQDMKKALDKDNPNPGGAPLFYSYAVPPLPDQFKPKKHAAAKEGEEGEGPSTTAIAYKGTQIPGIEAGSIGDQTLLLPPGVIICTMSSVVESTVAGQFTCTIRDDVKSPKGVVLIDGGSYIQGDYDVKVQTGQRRLRASTVAIWNLKGNCVVPLKGPMSDGLGRAGIDGDYDPHTWEKLGGALGVMLLENLTSLGQSALQSGNGNSYLQLNTGSMSSMANELLRANANIPPTITVHEGSQVGFWVTEATRFNRCFRVTTTDH